jgi:hypothetical protein
MFAQRRSAIALSFRNMGILRNHLPPGDAGACRDGETGLDPQGREIFGPRAAE